MRVLAALPLCLSIACGDGAASSPPGDTGAAPLSSQGGTTGDTPWTSATTEPTLGGSETCLRVHGGQDRVRSIESGPPLGNEPRTVQAWIRTGNATEQVAVGYGLAAPELGFYLGTKDGHPMVSGARLPLVDEGVIIADGAWHHLAVTWDGAEATLYTDGVPGASGPLVIDTADGEVVAGGTPTGHNLPFVGWIDDVRIFARARTMTELAEDLEGDLVGATSLRVWWDFEVQGEGPGIAIPDDSGHGVSGVTGGSPAFLPCR